MITPEEVSRCVELDPQTWRLYWKPRPELQPSWNSRYARKEAFFTVNDQGYKVGFLHKTPMRAHRVVWVLHYGEWPKGQIDHINGCRTDNRIENLRDVDASTNRRNQRQRVNNTSGVNGVSWHRRAQKWAVTIHLEPGKSRYLGLFESKQEAAAARRKAEAEWGYTARHGAAESSAA